MSIVTVSDFRFPGSRIFVRLKKQLLLLLRQGLQPRRLAWALALGLTVGILPTVWGTSVVCILLAWLFGLNQLVTQLANYLATPLHLLLLVPYFKFGTALFDEYPLPDSPGQLFAMLKSEPLATLELYWQANLQAIVVWGLSAPVLFGGSYLLASFLVRRLYISHLSGSYAED